MIFVNNEELITKANAGDVDAMLELVDKYWEDDYGSRDELNVPLQWLVRAAEQGSEEAKDRLESLARAVIKRTGSPKLIELLFTKAAELGHGSAQYNLAVAYAHGTGGVPINHLKAVYWWEKAIDAPYLQGNDDYTKKLKANALLGLASAYLNGRGTEINKDKAREYAAKGRDICNYHDDMHTDFTAIIMKSNSSSGGCYVATCVYGSYDSPEVLVLRRFRDDTLSIHLFGRWFIWLYYKTSPALVAKLGNKKGFLMIVKPLLDKLVSKLR
jgi:hypothetical protein